MIRAVFEGVAYNSRWLLPVSYTHLDVYKRQMELLQLFQLEPHAHDRPRNLAYGLQRRVEICRALVMKPKLLLLCLLYTSRCV